MATIRQRNGKWQVQIRREGHSARTKTFQNKRDATKWARQTEAELDANVFKFDITKLERMTVGELLERYRQEVTLSKRGAASEYKRLDGFARQTLAELPISKATPQVFCRYRDARLRTVSAGTVIRDLALLRTIFEVARTEWDLPLPENPIAKVRKPRAPESRNRRLLDGELEMLLAACNRNRNDWLHDGIVLAVSTGLRRGEILALRSTDIDFEAGILSVRQSKTGYSRRIPIAPVAAEVLHKRFMRISDDELRDELFPVSANAFRQCWERCKKIVASEYSAIRSLTFHDLRHEAVSRFFEMGLSVPEVALISGHRDLRMLFRYTHLKPEDLVGKISK